MDVILADPAPAVYVDELGDEVRVRVHYWVDSPGERDIRAVQSAYTRQIKRTFETEGLTISPVSELELTGRVGIDDSERSR